MNELESLSEQKYSRLKACVWGFVLSLRDKTRAKTIDWYLEAKTTNQYKCSLSRE